MAPKTLPKIKAKAVACPPKSKKKVIDQYPDALSGKAMKIGKFNDSVKESLGQGKKDGDGSDPRSPRNNLNNKGSGTSPSNSTVEEVFHIQQEAERKKKLAIGCGLGLLFLLLFWWLFKNSIYRILGWPIDGNGGYGGDGSSEGRDDFKGFGSGNGVGGLKERQKHDNQCWFNFPCQYDYKEDEWKKSKK